jgi:hypothetical protein
MDVPLHEQVRRLEQSKADLLKTVNAQADEIRKLQSPIKRDTKRALFIASDGALNVRPAPGGLDGPQRRWIQEHLVRDWADLSPFGSLMHFRTEWVLVYETETYYVYEQVS